MYSAVYKCVCKHQAERLHSDLMCHVESIVKKWSLYDVLFPKLLPFVGIQILSLTQYSRLIGFLKLFNHDGMGINSCKQ